MFVSASENLCNDRWRHEESAALKIIHWNLKLAKCEIF